MYEKHNRPSYDIMPLHQTIHKLMQENLELVTTEEFGMKFRLFSGMVLTSTRISYMYVILIWSQTVRYALVLALEVYDSKPQPYNPTE